MHAFCSLTQSLRFWFKHFDSKFLSLKHFSSIGVRSASSHLAGWMKMRPKNSISPANSKTSLVNHKMLIRQLVRATSRGARQRIIRFYSWVASQQSLQWRRCPTELLAKLVGKRWKVYRMQTTLMSGTYRVSIFEYWLCSKLKLNEKAALHSGRFRSNRWRGLLRLLN